MRLRLVLVAAVAVTCGSCEQHSLDEPGAELDVRETSLGRAPRGPEVRGRAASADQKHLAYIASRDGKQLVVRDGVEGPPYDRVLLGTLRLSPRGEQLAYAAVRQDRVYMVVNGAERGPYRQVQPQPSAPPGGRPPTRRGAILPGTW